MSERGLHLLPGAHFSIAKGLDQAILTAREYDCGTLQIFTKNARTWKETELKQDQITAFEHAREATGIRYVFSHASYLINLAAPDEKNQEKSRQALARELIRCRTLGISGLVLHPGSHMKDGMDAGIRRVAAGIDAAILSAGESAKSTGVRILLETMSGQGTGIGHRFEQLAEIRDRVRHPDRIGICFDTSHVFAAGYDIRSPAAFAEIMSAFREIFQQEPDLFHLNDSKKAMGTLVDRHEHIGEGQIGAEAFSFLMNEPGFASIPKIIETPKKKEGGDADRINLMLLKAMIRKN